MDQGARFPRVAAKAGHYESFYVKACAPGGGRGVWIRHTVHKRPGAEPTASIWFAWFDREGEGPRATKVTVGAAGLSAPAGGWIRVGEGAGESAAGVGSGERAESAAEIGPGRAEGRIATEALTASWSLTFAGDAAPCQYLPADWLYAAPLPRTKFVAPVPTATFAGTLELDGETIDIGGWPGMIGHNWGSEHAERWVWLEGTGFDADQADPGTYFDAGAARVAVAGRTTPWVPAGMLVLDGEEHRLGGLGAIGAARIEETPSACEFFLPGRNVVVHGRVAAPAKDFVGWVYADPKGPEHNTVNCSVADLELTVERPGRPARELRLAAGAAYELGMRETDHGIAIQPYPDG
jgi:hypothetical protein